jgi:hypothetical protein
MARETPRSMRWCVLAAAGWLACTAALAQQDSGAATQPAQTAPTSESSLQPSVITMHYKDAPLQGVLEDFAAQADADLGVQRRPIVEYAKSRRISIDLDRADFWTALRVVSDRAGLRPQPYASDPRMVFQVNANAMFGGFDMFSDAAKVSGGFLIIPWMCRLNRSIDYEHDDNSQSNLSLELIVMAEPRLHVIMPSNQEWLQQCLDEQGNSLVGSRRPSHFYNNGRGWWWTMQANLKEVPHMGQRIASLRGELKFTVQSKSEIIQIDDPSNVQNLTKAAGNHTIVFKQMVNQGGQWKLQLSITNLDMKPPPMRQMNNIFSTLQILDAQNQPYAQVGISSISNRGQETDVTLNFVGIIANAPMMRAHAVEEQALGPPKILRWEVPTETRVISAPFELTDLTLPIEP